MTVRAVRDADQAPTDLHAGFAAAMARLGPFELRPRLAAAVSGGADSTALALLADAWVRGQGGSLLALVADHGLRPESAAEARLTVSRLAQRGISARLLTITGLPRGTGLAARARAARYAVLTRACADEGILHLLLGHHARDQVETVMMRVLAGSADRGLAAMPALAETASLRLLRPLLGLSPAALRAWLRDAGMAWVEDPSNTDRRAQRPRLRLLAAGNHPSGEAALCQAVRRAGQRRAARDAGIAAVLAARVTLRPEGFALLSPGALPADAMAALLQTIAGSAYPPSSAAVAALAANPRAMTLAGVRLLPAGRLGPGLLLVREERAMAPPVPAVGGALWDNRFRLVDAADLPDGVLIGALGDDAAAFRRLSPLPAAVLRSLPALRRGKTLAVVPHLLYREPASGTPVQVVFSPPRPMAGAPFLPV